MKTAHLLVAIALGSGSPLHAQGRNDEAPASPARTAPAGPASYSSKTYRDNAVQALGDGWHRAHSTEGRFAVDMPAPFTDATSVERGNVGMLLRTVDATGATYIAVCEPTARSGKMAAAFVNALNDKQSTVQQFKGFPSVAQRTVEGANVVHSLSLRNARATCLLIVAGKADDEQKSEGSRKRFFDSLAFD